MIIFVIILIFLLSISVSAKPFTSYYGYGDSNMRATKCELGGQPFPLIMQSKYDKNSSCKFNIDGGGMTTSWALETFDSHITDWNKCIFECFGENDIILNESISNCSFNKIEMYNRSVQNNSEDNYWCCIWTLYNSSNVEEQQEYINKTIHSLLRYGIPYIPLYDAIDSIPYNGLVDNVNPDFYCDKSHYNRLAVNHVADFCWRFISGDIYSIKEENDKLIIKCNYTIPIIIQNVSDYDLTITRKDSLIFDSVKYFKSTNLKGEKIIYFFAENGTTYFVYKRNAHLIFIYAFVTLSIIVILGLIIFIRRRRKC